MTLDERATPSDSDWEALGLYGVINNSFVRDFNALSLVLELYGREYTKAEAQELFEKLVLVHEHVTPKHEIGF